MVAACRQLVGVRQDNHELISPSECVPRSIRLRHLSGRLSGGLDCGPAQKPAAGRAPSGSRVRGDARSVFIAGRSRGLRLALTAPGRIGPSEALASARQPRAPGILTRHKRIPVSPSAFAPVSPKHRTRRGAAHAASQGYQHTPDDAPSFRWVGAQSCLAKLAASRGG